MTTLERLGMRREGTRRMATVHPIISDIPRDTAVFGVSRTDF
jgi:RimJ/RimL family protein N-acetyltransferase